MDRIFRSTGLLQLVTFCLCGSGRCLKLLDGTLPVEYAHNQFNFASIPELELKDCEQKELEYFKQKELEYFEQFKEL